MSEEEKEGKFLINSNLTKKYRIIFFYIQFFLIIYNIEKK